MTNGNDFAVPQIEMSQTNLEHRIDQHFGLTKREHFAAMAMQGMLSGQDIDNGTEWNKSALAEDAVEFADALIKALNK